jgi:hypothetical protein
MAGRRHFARISHQVFPAEASPYGAMCSIIGASLQQHYGLPENTPDYLQTLLKELDEAETNPNSISKKCD